MTRIDRERRAQALREGTLMPRRADDNQVAIVARLREVGASVQHLHTVGRGCPDLLIGFRSRNWLAEIKNPTQRLSGRALTPDERTWHERWAGQVLVIYTADDALRMIGVIA